MTIKLNYIRNKLNFIDISYKNESLVVWNPNHVPIYLDLIKVNKYASEGIFLHIDKGDRRILYIKQDNIIYTVGSENEVQYQFLEALLEYLIKKFTNMFDLCKIFEGKKISPSIFSNFLPEIETTLKNLKDLDLIEIVDVPCRICNRVVPVFVKKSCFQDNTDGIVRFIYIHEGHAILVFIDQNFKERSTELIENITG